ncbi:MAG: hypothetical protein U0232_30760 [Thermomicrobiales bacterium]
MAMVKTVVPVWVLLRSMVSRFAPGLLIVTPSVIAGRSLARVIVPCAWTVIVMTSGAIRQLRSVPARRCPNCHRADHAASPNAPMSQCAPASVPEAALIDAIRPALGTGQIIAGIEAAALPGFRPMVFVGPPLFSNPLELSPEAVLDWLPLPLPKPQVSPVSRLWPPLPAVVLQSPVVVLSATIVFVEPCRPREVKQADVIAAKCDIGEYRGPIVFVFYADKVATYRDIAQVCIPISRDPQTGVIPA